MPEKLKVEEHGAKKDALMLNVGFLLVITPEHGTRTMPLRH